MVLKMLVYLPCVAAKETKFLVKYYTVFGNHI